MKIEPCDYCDFIGPFVSAEQPVRDLHRGWHDFTRLWQRAFGPLIEAFSGVTHAAMDTEERFPALRAAIADADETARQEAAKRDAASTQARELRRMGYGNIRAPHEDPRLLPDDDGEPFPRFREDQTP